MNMIAHQDISIQAILISDLIISKYLEITPIVFYVFEYSLSLVPSGNHMVKGSLIFDPRLPCHTQRISACLGYGRVKEWRVTVGVALAVSAVSSFVPV